MNNILLRVLAIRCRGKMLSVTTKDGTKCWSMSSTSYYYIVCGCHFAAVLSFFRFYYYFYISLCSYLVFIVRFTVCDMCVLPFGVITNKNKFKFQVCSLSVSGQWLVGSVAVEI